MSVFECGIEDFLIFYLFQISLHYQIQNIGAILHLFSFIFIFEMRVDNFETIACNLYNFFENNY